MAKLRTVSGAVVDIADDAVDVYLAAGFTRIEDGTVIPDPDPEQDPPSDPSGKKKAPKAPPPRRRKTG